MKHFSHKSPIYQLEVEDFPYLQDRLIHERLYVRVLGRVSGVGPENAPYKRYRWSNSWVGAMDSQIGKVHKIVELYPNEYEIELEDGFRYPIWVLQLEDYGFKRFRD